MPSRRVAGAVQLLRVLPVRDRHHELAVLRQHQGDQVGVSQGSDGPGDQLQRALVTGEHAAGDVGRLRQPLLPVLGLGEEAGVLDRDARGRRERLHDLLVLGGEGLAVVAGQVQVAEHLLAHPDRHPEEAAHRRMVGREPHRALVCREVVEADGVRLLDEQAEQTLALGQVTDLGDRRGVQADVDELVEARPFGRDDAQGAVLRVRQGDRGLDDASQHGGKVEVGDDRAVGLEQAAETLLGIPRSWARSISCPRSWSSPSSGPSW